MSCKIVSDKISIEKCHWKPISVNLALTYSCNYSCKFCFGRLGNWAEHFTYDRTLEIPSILKYLGTEKFTIEGGEPFLRPKLVESLLKEAKQCNLVTMVISNGSLIKREFLENISSNLDWLGLSVDSPNESTEVKLGRGWGNHINKVKEISKWAHSLGIKLKINVVVTKYNVNENLVDLLLELNPQRVKLFQFLHIQGINDRYAKSLKITEDEFRNFSERHMVLKDYGIDVAAESNKDMMGSYLMMLPDGHFFTNKYGKHTLSKKSLFDDPCHVLNEMEWDYRKFVNRGGIYDW